MKLFGYKLNIYLVIAAVALIFILSGSATCGCMKKSPMEAMTLLVNADKFITKYNANNHETLPNLHETSHDAPMGNNMAIFANNEFSKDCCITNQSNYYNRNGCVCPTSEQVKLLSTRGNNHK